MSLNRESPLVYLISAGEMTDENFPSKSAEFLAIVKSASGSHIPLIQVREKKISARRLYELTKSTMYVTRSTTKVLVNDRVDIAIASGADGVHLTSDSIPTGIVRRHLPAKFLIGRSTHSIDEVAEAKRRGADFVVLGPIFSTPGKNLPIGTEQLKKAASSFPDFPVLGLGGIDENNYRDVLAAGAAGFAAIRFLNDSRNLIKLSRELDL